MIRLVCLMWWLAGVQARALELAGVSVEPRVRVAAQALSLNGAGIRSKFMFKVYVAALYVAAPADKATQLIDQPGAKRIQFTLLRDVDVDRLLDGMHEGFKRNLSVEEKLPCMT